MTRKTRQQKSETKVETTAVGTTYDKFIKSLTPKEQSDFEQEYKDFLVSEMLLAAMQEDNVSVRELARLAGISPTIVQGIRSGEKQNVTVSSLVKILKALNCSLVVEKNGQRFPLELSVN